MFNARYIKDNQVYQVLDTYFDEMFHTTHFLIWRNNGWRWYSADSFLPPAVTKE